MSETAEYSRSSPAPQQWPGRGTSKEVSQCSNRLPSKHTLVRELAAAVRSTGFLATRNAHLHSLARGRCLWCGTPLGKGWHADHKIPVIAGGPTELRNGQALCASCNLSKGARWSRLEEAPLRRVDYTERVLPKIHRGVQWWRAVDVLVCGHVVRRPDQPTQPRLCPGWMVWSQLRTALR